MRIGVLTSSRADFGIYLPLLKVLKEAEEHDLEVIAFGTHLSERHGYTLDEIYAQGFSEIHEVITPMNDSDSLDVSESYATAIDKFVHFWNENLFDLVFCLGDRFEMNAAVQAGIPFNVRFAHFHGGEKTLGAYDNTYRHQITLASQYHFTATEAFADRVRELLDEGEDRVFNIGSLSLSDLQSLPLLDEKSFREKYYLPEKPYVLITLHPETKSEVSAVDFIESFIESLTSMPETVFQVINLPNADTNSSLIRKALLDYHDENLGRCILIESFGKINYFSAMKYAEFLLGNSSSGIIEAASFGKYVINIGDRQKGRLRSGNVIDCTYHSSSILENVSKLLAGNRNFSGENKYVRKDTIEMTLNILKQIADGKL